MRITFFHVLFLFSAAALVLTGVMILAQSVLRTPFPDSLRCIVAHLDSESIKNISTTVGLTGVLFTWLLQVIGDRMCGQPMSELFHNTFPEYIWQIFLFIVAVLLSIGYASPARCTEWDLLISGCAFLSLLAGISNMWILCSVFLFSSRNCRHTAFLYLSKKLNKKDEEFEAALVSLQKEMPVCIRDGDVQYVVPFLKLVAELSGQSCVRTFSLVRNVAYETDPLLRSRIPLYIQSACKENLGDQLYLLSVYLLALSDLFPEERSDRSSWSKDIYSYVWHYFSERLLAEKKLSAQCFYIYCAYVAIKKNLSEENDIHALDLIIACRKDVMPDPPSKERSFETFLQTYGSIMDVTEQDDSINIARDYYEMLLSEIITGAGPASASRTERK